MPKPALSGFFFVCWFHVWLLRPRGAEEFFAQLHFLFDLLLNTMYSSPMPQTKRHRVTSHRAATDSPLKTQPLRFLHKRQQAQTGSGVAPNPGEAVPPRTERVRTNAPLSPGGIGGSARLKVSPAHAGQNQSLACRAVVFKQGSTI